MLIFIVKMDILVTLTSEILLQYSGEKIVLARDTGLAQKLSSFRL